MSEIRTHGDFLFPYPSLRERLGYYFQKYQLSKQDVVERLIDESHWQYSNTKSVNHLAMQPTFTGTIVKSTDGFSTDSAFTAGHWKRALDDGAVVMTYHFFRSNLNGRDQANYHLNATYEFQQEVSKYGRVITFGDYERDGTSISVSTRVTNMRLFHDELNTNSRESGIYSSPSLWNEMYGGVEPPDYVWLWLAHWTPGNPYFPSNWNVAKRLLHQRGVWDNYYWCTPVPGNTPDIDVNDWVHSQSLKVFMNWNIPEPNPDHDHDEINQRLQRLDTQVRDLEQEVIDLTSRVSVLENSNPAHTHSDLQSEIDNLDDRVYKLEHPLEGKWIATMETEGGKANARYAKSYNDATPPKPIMEIWQSPTGQRQQYDDGEKVWVAPEPTDADGTEDYYQIYQAHLAGDTALYIRVSDIRGGAPVLED